MTIHADSTHLLATVPAVFEGVGLAVLQPDGTPVARFGAVVGAVHGERRVLLPDGELVATFPAAAAGAEDLVGAMLAVVAERERLESDIESMSQSSLRLLEQVAMLGETLPRLSAGADDDDIARLGVHACQLAAGAEQVVYVRRQPGKALAEVVVHAGGGDGDAIEPLLPADQGLLAEALAAEGVLLRAVPEGGRLGEPGAAEHPARRQVLAVPVTYGAGDKRVVLGALLLLDKRADRYTGQLQFGNEEGQVAESFAAMLGAVLGARHSAALGKELSMAQAIQRQILPEAAVALAGFDVAAEYQACGAVGGDYFDYVPLADGRTLVVVADVSGHNLASGMMMVSARATLRTLCAVHREPAQVFRELAANMYGDLTRTERFLTAAAVALRAGERAVDYVSAGHNPLFVYRARGDRIEVVGTDSTILGFLPRPDYQHRRLALEPGDCLLLFTDGITEAMDQGGEMFGEERLAALFAQLCPGRTAAGILAGIVHELERYRGAPVGSDDVTAVVIRCVEPRGRR